MTTHHHGRSPRAGKRAKTDRPRKPQKLQPILLDRLAHALEAQGVSLKRTDVLKVAAAAFGFHNPNEFSAAALDVPAVEALAKVTMADGETLTLVRDPVAGSTYAIEDEFIAQVVADERREFLGVSPYGHLLDLSALPDIDPTRLGCAEIGADTPLHIAIIEHRHGTSANVALTEGELYDQIAAFCSEYWSEAEHRAGSITDYTTSKEIVDAYFAGHDSETLYVEEASLPRSAKAQATTRDLDPLYPYADYRAYLAVTGETASYPHWVAARKADASSSRRFWDTRESVLMLAPGDFVVNDIHHVCADGRTLKPGMLARVENVVTVAGCVQVSLTFAGGETALYTDRERGGAFPLLVAVCSYTSKKAAGGLDWITSGNLPGFGALVTSTIDAQGEDLAIPAGTILRIGVNFAGLEGRRRLVLRFEDGPHQGQTTILTALPHRGVFPLRLISEPGTLLPGDDLFSEDDWREAVIGTAAEGMSLREWNAKARAEKIHLRDGWLTEAEARALTPGEHLTIQVHGRGDAYTHETGSYEGDYAPGTPVVVEEVVDYGGQTGLIVHVATNDSIEVIVPVRVGYVPLARVKIAKAEIPAELPPTHSLYLYTDWSEAVAARACIGLSFEQWNDQARNQGIHRRDGWLTEAKALTLKQGDILAIQVHGHGRGWIQEWEVYDGRYAPGTLVTVDSVQNMKDRGIYVYVTTADHIEIALPARAGFLPLARVSEEDPTSPVSPDRPSPGEEIVFEGVDCRIEVWDIPTRQPLESDGIIVIVDQYRETHTCTRDEDRWIIVPVYQLSDAQREALDAE